MYGRVTGVTRQDSPASPGRMRIGRTMPDQMEIRALGNQLPWPDIFEVTILDLGGKTRTYRVMTWFADAKAVAIAVQHHRSKTSPTDAMDAIYDIRVRRIGPAAKNESGAVSGEDVDLMDRMEF
jgi:hypothetical protein